MAESITLKELTCLAVAGAFGGVAGLCARDSRLKLPRVLRHEEDGPVFDLGFLGTVLLGSAVAVFGAGQQEFVYLPLDTSGARTFAAGAFGFAAAVLGPAFVNSVVGLVLKLPALARKIEETKER